MKNEIAELATSLKKETAFFEENDFVKIEGVKLRYPYIEVYPQSDIYGSFGSGIPQEVWESREAMSDLFTDENIPKHWVKILKRINKKRQKQGSDTPMDLISASYFVGSENSEGINKIGMKPFIELSEGGPDLRDKEEIIKRVNMILKDPVLSKVLEKSLIYQIPDVGGAWLDDEPLVEILKKLSVKGKRMLDIGCGVGREAHEYATKHEVKTIAVERQYHSRWYDEYWKSKKKGLNFIRCDAFDNLPFADNSIDFALLRFVVPHVSLKGLEKILGNAIRVLRPKGILMIGPESRDINTPPDEYDDWRYYTKEVKRGKPFYRRITHDEALKILDSSD